MWTTKGPACTAVHINLYTQWLRDVLYVFQCLHPFRRKELDIVFVVPLHAIERCNLHGTDAYTGIFRKVPLEVLFINS